LSTTESKYARMSGHIVADSCNFSERCALPRYGWQQTAENEFAQIQKFLDCISSKYTF